MKKITGRIIGFESVKARETVLVRILTTSNGKEQFNVDDPSLLGMCKLAFQANLTAEFAFSNIESEHLLRIRIDTDPYPGDSNSQFNQLIFQ